jgi:HK97 family phage portal protein
VLIHDQANPETTAFVFRQCMLLNALLTGNAYAEIQRDGAGRPVALWPIAPSDRVSIDRREDGALRYRVRNSNGSDVYIDARDIVHFSGPSADGVLGIDTVHALREVFGLSLASERFAATYFGNNTIMGGVVTTPQVLPEATRKSLRDAIEARHQGVQKAHRLMLLEAGAEYTPLSANLRDSQFTELRTHQIREVARAFRMPPSKLGDLADATFSNVEQMNLQYYVSCLQPWLRMIESELTAKLISPLERNMQTIEFVVDGLLRADVEKRGGYYATMVSHGLMTPNEIRRLENLPALPGGDTLRVPANTTTLGEEDAA